MKRSTDTLAGYDTLKACAAFVRGYSPSVWEGMTAQEILTVYLARPDDAEPMRLSTCPFEWIDPVRRLSLLAFRLSEGDGPPEIVGGVLS